MGRCGTWFAYQQLPIQPDIVTAGKGLGAGFAPISAALCTAQVYDAIAAGSRSFDLGHTWDGAPVSCAIGLAVMEELLVGHVLDRVQPRGPRLLEELLACPSGNATGHVVSGRGY